MSTYQTASDPQQQAVHLQYNSMSNQQTPNAGDNTQTNSVTFSMLSKEYVVTTASHFAVSAGAAVLLASGPIGWFGIATTAAVTGGIKTTTDHCLKRSGIEQSVRNNCGSITAKALSVVGNTIVMGVAGGATTTYSIAKNATCALGGMLGGTFLQFIANKGMDRGQLAKDGYTRAAGSIVAGFVGGLSGAYATNAVIDGIETLVQADIQPFNENATNSTEQTTTDNKQAIRPEQINGADEDFFDAVDSFSDEVTQQPTSVNEVEKEFVETVLGRQNRQPRQAPDDELAQTTTLYPIATTTGLVAETQPSQNRTVSASMTAPQSSMIASTSQQPIATTTVLVTETQPSQNRTASLDMATPHPSMTASTQFMTASTGTNTPSMATSTSSMPTATPLATTTENQPTLNPLVECQPLMYDRENDIWYVDNRTLAVEVPNFDCAIHYRNYDKLIKNVPFIHCCDDGIEIAMNRVSCSSGSEGRIIHNIICKREIEPICLRSSFRQNIPFCRGTDSNITSVVPSATSDTQSSSTVLNGQQPMPTSSLISTPASTDANTKVPTWIYAVGGGTGPTVVLVTVTIFGVVVVKRRMNKTDAFELAQRTGFSGTSIDNQAYVNSQFEPTLEGRVNVVVGGTEYAEIGINNNNSPVYSTPVYAEVGGDNSSSPVFVNPQNREYTEIGEGNRPSPVDKSGNQPAAIYETPVPRSEAIIIANDGTGESSDVVYSYASTNASLTAKINIENRNSHDSHDSHDSHIYSNTQITSLEGENYQIMASTSGVNVNPPDPEYAVIDESSTGTRQTEPVVVYEPVNTALGKTLNSTVPILNTQIVADDEGDDFVAGASAPTIIPASILIPTLNKLQPSNQAYIEEESGYEPMEVPQNNNEFTMSENSAYAERTSTSS